jgi:hypothetical protein
LPEPARREGTVGPVRGCVLLPAAACAPKVTGWRANWFDAGERSTTGGKVILDQHEAERRNREQDVFELVELDDHVDIFVISGLHAQPRVDTPTAVRPDDVALPVVVRRESVRRRRPAREGSRALTTRLTASERPRDAQSSLCLRSDVTARGPRRRSSSCVRTRNREFGAAVGHDGR